MNKRERVLVFLLLAVVILFGGFNFLIKPAMNSLTEAQNRLEVKKAEFDTVQMLVTRKTSVIAENEELETRIKIATEEFFPELTIDKIQYFFTEQARKTDVTISSINMSTPTTTSITDSVIGESEISYGLKNTANSIASSIGVLPEQNPKSVSSSVASSELLCSDVSISCLGTYKNVMKFVDNLSSMNRTVATSSIVLSDMQSGDVTASLSIKMYMLEKLSEDEILNETIKTTTTKTNLF